MYKKILSTLIVFSVSAAMTACGAKPAQQASSASAVSSSAADAGTDSASASVEEETASASSEEAADQADSLYYAYEGTWEKKDGGQTILTIAASGYENTFDVFVDVSAEESSQNLRSMQAIYVPEDESLSYSNGTIAERVVAKNDVPADKYISTGNAGSFSYDADEEVLYWTDDSVVSSENVTAFVRSEEAAEPAEETAEYEGTAEELLNNVVFVKDKDGNSHMCLFTPETKFDLGEDDVIGVDDDIQVKCSVSGEQVRVTDFKVVRHKVKINTFEGVVSEVKNNTVTVTNRTLTVTFSLDADTEVKGGKLDEGAEVKIGYTGDMSESPYAAEIEVVKEGQTSELPQVRGIVTDTKESVLLVSINSSHSYTFKYDKKTSFTGASDKAEIGDDVAVRYTGKLSADPTASNVNIIRKADQNKYTMAGTIEETGDKSIKIHAGTGSYIFAVNKDTVFTGDKLTKGARAVVKYVNKLDSNPTAISVYCAANDEPGQEQKKEADLIKKYKFEKERLDETQKNSREESGKADTEKEETVTPEQNKQEEVTPAPAQEEPAGETPAPAEEEIVEEEPAEETPVPSEEEIVEEEPAEETPAPEKEEIVEEEPAEETPAPSEEEIVEEEQAEETPAPAEEEPAEETPEPEKEEPAEGEAPVEKIKVEKEGSIKEWHEDGGNSFCVITFKDGETLTLQIMPETKIASGYLPEKGDTVKVVYEKNSSTVLKLQLLERPEAEDKKAEEAEEEKAEEAEEEKTEE